MKIDLLPSISKGLLNVIIETPKMCTCKYAYDNGTGLFKLRKPLPSGMMFPFDFGFVPGTLAADGDPLDAIVIMEHSSYPGCLVPCRIIGILEVTQQDKGERPLRNDRVICVAEASLTFAGLASVSRLGHMKDELERFFINYGRHEGRELSAFTWRSRAAALRAVAASATGPAL